MKKRQPRRRPQQHRRKYDPHKIPIGRAPPGRLYWVNTAEEAEEAAADAAEQAREAAERPRLICY